MNDKIAIALFTVSPYPWGTGSASDQSPRFVVWLRSEGQAARDLCCTAHIPGSPGPDHKLINIHSVWCINLPENTTITISLKICDGNRFPATSDFIMSVDHRP